MGAMPFPMIRGSVLKLRAIIVGLMAISSTPALADTPRQFDLQCDALRHWRDGTDAVDPISVHIRADLDANQWCEGECRVTFQINEVSALHILFRGTDDLIYENDNSGATPTTWKVVVARENGTYADVRWSPYERSYWSGGTCTVQAFSGFPAPPNRLF